jgi:hypothetical protein
MNKSIRMTVLGVVLCGMFQAVVHAEESANPVRFSLGFVAHATDNRDSAAVNEQDNVDLYLRPKLELIFESERSLLSFYYVPAYRFRSEPGDNQDESSLQHDLKLEFARDITERIRFRVYEQFRVQDDPQIEEGSTVTRGDQSYVRNVLEGGINFDILQYSNLDVLLRSVIKRYDDDAIATTSDEDESTLRLEHRYQLTRTLRSLLSGSFSAYTYDSGAPVERDFSVLALALGVENSFTPNLLGGIRIGGQACEYSDSSLDGEVSPYARLSIEGLAGESIRLGTTLDHGVRDSDVYPFVSQEYTQLRGFAHARLGSRCALRGSATYRVSSYDEDDLPATATPAVREGDETTIVGDLEFSVTPVSMLALFTGLRVEDIDSDVGQSYTKATVRFGTTLSF